MNAKSTDEIICTNCGRPNLPEAVKCWYCQIPLEKEKEAASEEPTEEDAQAAEEISQTNKAQAAEAEREIPDWLKRIRELKEADHIDDDVEDQWQQQDLFNDADDEAETKQHSEAKSKSAGHHSQPKTDKPAQAAEPDKDKQQPALDMHKKQEEKVEGNPPVQDETEESPSEDLPDGFIKFDSKIN